MFELRKKVSGNVNDFCKEARGEIEVAAFGKYYCTYYRVFLFIFSLFIRYEDRPPNIDFANVRRLHENKFHYGSNIDQLSKRLIMRFTTEYYC